MIGRRMELDLTPISTRMILDLAWGGIESVADGDRGILMRAPRLRLASDHDFASGNCDIQADPEQIALMVAPVLALRQPKYGSC